MTTPSITEIIARAIYGQSYRNCCGGALPDTNDESWISYESEAAAAIAALEAAGYAIVPKEPTEAMWEAANNAHRQMMPWAEQFRAMIQVGKAKG